MQYQKNNIICDHTEVLMNEIIKNIKTRRSVRKFKDEQIDEKELNAILSAGLCAPSAMNTQNWQLTVVQGVDRLTSLQKVVSKAIGNPGYHRFYGAPSLVIVSTPKDYAHGAQDSSVVLQTMFLAAHSLNIGSVWINQLLNISDEADVRQVLSGFNVPEDHKVWGCAALGYSDAGVSKERENKGTIVFAS